MTPLSYIWILFVIIFLFLAIFSFIRASQKIDKFNMSQRPSKNVTVKIAGSELDAPLKNFVVDFNKYIDSYNKSNLCQNRIAGFGYIAAALISLISLLIELKISIK